MVQSKAITVFDGLRLCLNFLSHERGALQLEPVIVELEEIARSERIRLRRYNYLYNHLREYRFYLLIDDCRRINSAIQEIEKGQDEKDPMRTKIIRHSFEPNANMDPALYYEPEEATDLLNCVAEKDR